MTTKNLPVGCVNIRDGKFCYSLMGQRTFRYNYLNVHRKERSVYQ